MSLDHAEERLSFDFLGPTIKFDDLPLDHPHSCSESTQASSVSFRCEPLKKSSNATHHLTTDPPQMSPEFDGMCPRRYISDSPTSTAPVFDGDIHPTANSDPVIPRASMGYIMKFPWAPSGQDPFPRDPLDSFQQPRHQYDETLFPDLEAEDPTLRQPALLSDCDRVTDSIPWDTLSYAHTARCPPISKQRGFVYGYASDQDADGEPDIDMVDAEEGCHDGTELLRSNADKQADQLERITQGIAHLSGVTVDELITQARRRGFDITQGCSIKARIEYLEQLFSDDIQGQANTIKGTSASAGSTLKLACASCFRNKKKCDRRFPCGTCTKSGTECRERSAKPRPRQNPRRMVGRRH